MLELKNVNISTYKDRDIIKDLNLNINNKDKIAIIGEEGNGKSTLLKYIYNPKLIEDYCIADGTVIRNNLNIGYLEQFLSKDWNNVLIEDYFLKDLPIDEIDYDRYNDLAKVYNIFTTLHLNTEFLNTNKSIGTLSGGEKVKMQIAKILLNSPDILLLDEPTNDLDIEGLKWLENFILNTTLPIIYVSHDETLLENTANCILHLEQINNKAKSKYTFERIGYKEYVEKRLHLLSKQEQISKKEHEEHEKQMQKFRQIYERVNFEQENISRANPSGGRLLKKKMKSVKSLEKRLNEKELTEKPNVEEHIILKFHNEDNIYNKKTILNFNLDELYVNDRKLSENISLLVKGKDKVVIIGSNGAGKTTLLKAISENLKKRNDLIVGYMPQNYDESFDNDMPVLDFIKSQYTKEEETLARTYMGSMKFTTEEMLGKIGNLSGGQKAKLFLVKLILKKCNVLILDEPTRNLSPLSNPVIRQTLKDFNGCIISVSHDRKYIDEVCNSVYMLTKDGLEKII